MRRRKFLKNIPTLIAAFIGCKIGRDLDNCGVKITRNSDGGLVIDGSKAGIIKPKDGYAITLQNFMTSRGKI